MPAHRHRAVVTHLPTKPPRSTFASDRKDPSPHSRNTGADDDHGVGVLLINGQPGSSLIWTRIEPLLQARGMDVFGCDDAGPVLDQFAQASTLARRLGDERRSPAVIVGHGFGAGTALALAAWVPERVRALVLVAPMLRAGGIPFVDRVLATPAIGPVASWLGFRTAGLAFHLPWLRRRFLLERGGLTAGQADQVVRSFTRGHSWRRFCRERRNLAGDARRLQRMLGQVECPTFVIAARNDRVAPFPTVSALAARVAGDARLITTDSGHLIPIDDPGVVLNTVLRAQKAAPRPVAEQPTQRRM